MKKLTLIFAALAVCASMMLTGCSGENSTGNNNGSNNSGNNNSGNSDNSDKNDNSDKDDKDDNGDDNKEKAEYVIYTFDESTGKYTGNYLGIGADFDPDVWESVDPTSNNGGASTEDELKKKLETVGGTIFELMVIKEDNTNISITVGNIKKMTEEEYVDYSIESIDQITAGSIDNVKAEKITLTVGGASHVCLDISGEVGDSSVYERMIFINKGDLMGMITITSFEKKDVDELTSIFYAL